MNLETAYSRIIIIKTLMLILIIIWGAFVQIETSVKDEPVAPTDIGGILFLLFSLLYFTTSYFLYIYHYLGKNLFLPMISIFVLLGFLTEFFNPTQFSKDMFYLIIFYIISPLFFIGQGFLVCLIYFTDIKLKFNH